MYVGVHLLGDSNNVGTPFPGYWSHLFKIIVRFFTLHSLSFPIFYTSTLFLKRMLLRILCPFPFLLLFVTNFNKKKEKKNMNLSNFVTPNYMFNLMPTCPTQSSKFMDKRCYKRIYRNMHP